MVTNVGDINPQGKANIDDFLASLGAKDHTGGVQMYTVLRTSAGVYFSEVKQTPDGVDDPQLLSINGVSMPVLTEFSTILREHEENN